MGASPSTTRHHSSVRVMNMRGRVTRADHQPFNVVANGNVNGTRVIGA